MVGCVPVEGGSANDYDYCSGDPVNCTDLDGTISLPGNKLEQNWCRVPSRLRLCARAHNYARGSLRSTYLRYGGVGGAEPPVTGQELTTQISEAHGLAMSKAFIDCLTEINRLPSDLCAVRSPLSERT